MTIDVGDKVILIPDRRGGYIAQKAIAPAVGEKALLIPDRKGGYTAVKLSAPAVNDQVIVFPEKIDGSIVWKPTTSCTYWDDWTFTWNVILCDTAYPLFDDCKVNKSTSNTYSDCDPIDPPTGYDRCYSAGVEFITVAGELFYLTWVGYKTWNITASHVASMFKVSPTQYNGEWRVYVNGVLKETKSLEPNELADWTFVDIDFGGSYTNFVLKFETVATNIDEVHGLQKGMRMYHTGLVFY